MTDPANATAGVIAPPPLLVAATLAVTLLLDWAWPAPVLGATAQTVAGSAMLIAGLALVVVCARRFVRAGTNVPTYRPTTALVTDGPYRLTRNPIYVGLLLAYLGLAVLVDSLWMIAGAAALALVLDRGVIAREEVYLEATFGADYRAYKDRVRRWL
jgi:protein-S-isoprenylcysteine O-methyltransferase Ste14